MSTIKNPSVFDMPTEPTDEELSSLVDGTITPFDDGDLVTGTVVKIDRDEVLLDIGFKSEGVIPARELSIRKDVDTFEAVHLGDQIEALVMQKEDKDGRLMLSKKRAEYERSWISVEEKFNAGQNVTGEVIEVVKGGLILDIGLRGFLPASLVDLRRVKDLSTYLGTEIEARIIEMDRNRNNVVLSRRVVLEEGRRAERAEVLSKLEKGMRLKGTVSSIVDFGAFVDLGGIDGLVHISELAWSHVNHPSEVVKVGQEVEVLVLDVDMNRERISLGLKQTTEDPWNTLVKSYPVGSIVEGTVTKLVPFGCFVALGEGIEGLVHISEMAPRHVDVPSQVCAVGDTVQVKVMEVEVERRRISLSMKEAAATLGMAIEVSELVNPDELAELKEAVSAQAAEKEDPAEEEPADEEAPADSEEPAVESEDEAAEEAPAEALAEEEAPAEEPAAEEAPAKEAEEEAPVEETPAEETTEEAPAEEEEPAAESEEGAAAEKAAE